MDKTGRCFTTKEVAEMYRCSPVTVASWVKAGRLTAINLGGNRYGPYVFRKEDLEAFERKSEKGSGRRMRK